MLVSGIFGRKNIYDLEVEMEFPDEIFAQTDSPAGVRMINRRRWMPAFLVSVTAGDGRAFFPYVGPRSTALRSLSLRFEKRGGQTLEGLVVSSTFPFNFFTRFRGLRRRFDLTVYPRPLRCELSHVLGNHARTKGEKPLNKAGDDSDILSIRDYVSGDPPKYISWKSTAKTGNLKTKELSAIAREQVIIDFDRLDRGDVERLLSCVTYTVLNLFRSRVPVGLRISGETLQPGLSPSHKKALLTRLALYGQS